MTKVPSGFCWRMTPGYQRVRRMKRAVMLSPGRRGSVAGGIGHKRWVPSVRRAGFGGGTWSNRGKTGGRTKPHLRDAS
eukprot:4455011-Prymnesium_polylepis.1